MSAVLNVKWKWDMYMYVKCIGFATAPILCPNVVETENKNQIKSNRAFFVPLVEYLQI